MRWGRRARDLIRPLAAELAVLVVAGGLAALVALRWVGPVLSALPQLAPLGAATAAPGGGAALWTLAVAAATWAAVCLGLLLLTSVRPPALPGTPGPRATGPGGRQRALRVGQSRGVGGRARQALDRASAAELVVGPFARCRSRLVTREVQAVRPAGS